MTTTATLIDVSQSITNGFQTSSVPPQEFITASVEARINYISPSSSGSSVISSYTEHNFVFSASYGEINNFRPINLNTSSIKAVDHINDVDGMYYIDYRFHNFQNQNNINFGTPPEVKLKDTSGSYMEITQSLSPPDASQYKFTGSLQLFKSNENSNIGDIVANQDFILNSSGSSGSLSLKTTYLGDYKYNDKFRFAISSISKTPSSGLEITAYTSSINPRYSKWSINPDAPYNLSINGLGYNSSQPINSFIPNFYGEGVLPFNLALNCQPLINNILTLRDNPFLMDVDYTNILGSITPINQEQLINFTADRATVPKSNYSSLKSTLSRYLGSKSSNKFINKWSIGDVGTLGKLPGVELRNSYFGYFDSIEDPYPNKNDCIKLNLTYLVDGEGNAIPSSLKGLSKNILEKTFPFNSKGKISLLKGFDGLKKFNEYFNFSLMTSYPTPIIYSQNSSKGYVTEIPITGSERISRFDNNDSNSISYYTFTAIGKGSSSVNNSQNFSTILSPTDEIKFDSSVPTGTNPYNNGVMTFNNNIDTAGEDLSNSQKVKLETSFTTTFVYQTKRTRDEMNVKLSLINNNQNIPFKVKDLELTVIEETNPEKEYKLGSVIGEGWLNFVSKENPGLKDTTDKPKLDPLNRTQITVDSEIHNFLLDNGFDHQYKKNSTKVFLKWDLTADSGDYIFKGEDQVKWNIEGSFKDTRNDLPQSKFFPPFFTDHLPTKISSIGTLDHLFNLDNKAIAPYWLFGSELSNPVSTPKNVIFMESPNMNEAYGNSFYQGDLTYNPSDTEYFPNGLEPVNTQFDKIEFPIRFKIGDEIRFANNENYTYKIIDVTSPQENIMSDGKGRIKLTLNKPIPGDVNKDFFLLRRNIPDANSIYLNTQFPYTKAQNSLVGYTSPGILYPEFPTEKLNESASVIIENLTDKGILI